MKILALDCSTEACSVALLNDSNFNNDCVADSCSAPDIIERVEMAARQHTQRLLPMVEQLLADTETSLSQLDAIAFGRGPGSFTGLRICLGAVQGLAFGADLPVVPISSLAAQAQSLFKQNTQQQDDVLFLSTLDARMDEVYWAVYKGAGTVVELLGVEHLSAPEQLIPLDVRIDNLIAAGSGANYRQRITGADQYQSWQAELFPSAAAITELAVKELAIGNVCSAAEAVPTYLRDQVAWKKQPLPNV